MMTGWVEAGDHLGLGWFFEAHSLHANGHANVAAAPDEPGARSAHNPTRGIGVRAAKRSVFRYWPDGG